MLEALVAAGALGPTVFFVLVFALSTLAAFYYLVESMVGAIRDVKIARYTGKDPIGEDEE